MNEWFKLWQIREEHANQAIDGETELEVSDKGPLGYQSILHSCDVTPFSQRNSSSSFSKQDETYEKEEEEQTKEEQTSEKEVAHQGDISVCMRFMDWLLWSWAFS